MTTPASPSPDAVRNLLGLVGYSSLGSFALLAQDAAAAPDINTRIRLSRLAASELAEISVIEEMLGGDHEVMVAFAPVLKEFLVRAEPGDWWELLMRSYVGFNLLEDLLRELCNGLPDDVAVRVQPLVGVSGHADFVAETLLPILAVDEKLASRLALWGRRVVGEAMSLVHRLFQEWPVLAELLPGDGEPAAREAALIGRLQAEHARRLGRLQLTS